MLFAKIIKMKDLLRKRISTCKLLAYINGTEDVLLAGTFKFKCNSFSQGKFKYFSKKINTQNLILKFAKPWLFLLQNI